MSESARCCRCPQPAVVLGRLIEVQSLRQLIPKVVGECGFCAGCLELLKVWCCPLPRLMRYQAEAAAIDEAQGQADYEQQG